MINEMLNSPPEKLNIESDANNFNHLWTAREKFLEEYRFLQKELKKMNDYIKRKKELFKELEDADDLFDGIRNCIVEDIIKDNVDQESEEFLKKIRNDNGFIKKRHLSLVVRNNKHPFYFLDIRTIFHQGKEKHLMYPRLVKD